LLVSDRLFGHAKVHTNLSAELPESGKKYSFTEVRNKIAIERITRDAAYENELDCELETTQKMFPPNAKWDKTNEERNRNAQIQ
jgi:hypothetical protein